MVPGALLAAGRSLRMGRSKALLPAGPDGPTFVGRLAHALRAGGIEELLIVGRVADGPLQQVVTGLGARYVENPQADDGQISSMVCAVDAVERPDVGGLLVLPVDQPLVTAATVAALLDAFARAAPPIARATCRGRHGHPVIFSREVFGALRAADRQLGAKAVMRDFDVLDVAVEDEGVLVDVDDPATYARVFGSPLP